MLISCERLFESFLLAVRCLIPVDNWVKVDIVTWLWDISSAATMKVTDTQQPYVRQREVCATMRPFLVTDFSCLLTLTINLALSNYI